MRQAAVDRTAQYKIPHDAQWGDIDIMDRALDFTLDQERCSLFILTYLACFLSSCK
jgi:alpha-glucosidase (family GH31 glycosyl hydrolase)